jgi:hypothetical protein
MTEKFENNDSKEAIFSISSNGILKVKIIFIINDTIQIIIEVSIQISRKFHKILHQLSLVISIECKKLSLVKLSLSKAEFIEKLVFIHLYIANTKNNIHEKAITTNDKVSRKLSNHNLFE